MKTWRWLWLILVTTTAFAVPLEVRSGLLRVTLHDPNDRMQLETVFSTFKQAQRDLQAIGLELGQVRLEAFQNAVAFARATGEPAFVAASTRGQVIRSQRLRALQVRGLLKFTIRHEVFHVAQPSHVPRWLAEGLARHFSGEDANDPKTPTGLEARSEIELEPLLTMRSSNQDLNLAYIEATRRAIKQLERGWKYVLAKH